MNGFKVINIIANCNTLNIIFNVDVYKVVHYMVKLKLILNKY